MADKTSKTQATINTLNATHAANGGCSCPDPHDFWHKAVAAQTGEAVRLADASHPDMDVMVAVPKWVSVLCVALRENARRYSVQVFNPAELPPLALTPEAAQAAAVWVDGYTAGLAAAG